MGSRARAPKTVAVPYRGAGTAVFVRFVFFQLVDGHRSRLGLFQARDAAIDSPLAPDWALAQVRMTMDWFNDNLDAPTHYDSGGFRRRATQPALCWFKAEAVEHIARMFELKTALEACGIHVDVLRTRDPGRVVFEDKHQVAAQPEHRRF